MDMTGNLKPQSLKGVLFIAKVVANNDPEKEGEVQIRIDGRMDEIPDADLPWARPQVQNEFFKVPDVGDKIYVEFLDGSPYHPFYYGRAIPPNGVNVFNDDYPNHWGMSDGKNYIRVNKNTNVFEIINGSGCILKFNPSTMEVTIPDDVKINAGNNVEITTGNDTKINAGNKLEVTTGADATITTGADATITAGANLTVNTSANASVTAGGNATITASGMAKITASSIMLN